MATGRVVIDQNRCKGCELCVPTCPQGVLVMADTFNSKGYYPAQYLDPNHSCTGCALCAVVCPDACFTVFRDLPTPKENRRHAQAIA